MKAKLLVIYSLLMGCGQASDSLGEDSKEPAGLSYEIHREQEEIPAPTSPFGYWEKSIQYPVFESSDKKELASKVNSTLSALVEKYQCKNDGDQTFSATVRHKSKSLLSITYEAMWMCPPMPHPDSTAGAINVDLRNGEEIAWGSQFQHDAAKESFLKRLAEKRRKQAEAQSCQPPADFGYFYVEENKVRFVFQSEAHSDACTVTVAIDRDTMGNFLTHDSPLNP